MSLVASWLKSAPIELLTSVQANTFHDFLKYVYPQ